MPIDENEARQNLETLIKEYENLSLQARKDASEANVVVQFVKRLLGNVLGWPTDDLTRFKLEMKTQAGRPDITLFPEKGGTIFVEGKRFGVIKELEEARYTIAGTITPGQLALPGMAKDRTKEEQQAINYAFENGGIWAILTNFEKLRLFNAPRDWLVLSFESPRDYLHDFDWLWQLAYHNIIDGSLDRLNNQRLTKDVDLTYLEFINEWREKLAQDVVANRDTNRWALHEDGSLNLAALRAVVQRFLDRLVIVRFAEDHLVIPPGTLRQFYELRTSNPYTHTMNEYLGHFFRRFDQDHNSALFAENTVDRANLSDNVLLPLIGKLYEARYRAMPADILGNTYEQYLGKTLVQLNGAVKTADNLETRKKQGSYYTPQVIVRYIVDNSLGRYLYGTQNGRADGTPIPGEARKTASDIRDLRVLDSACGSGSFLIYAYQVLAEFYELEVARLEQEGEIRRQQLVASGMTSPLDIATHLTPYSAEIERIRDYRRLILESHLYGVDLDPQAAEIAVVNLMMRAMERRRTEKRLPLLLNQNVKVGNSLIGLRPDDPRLGEYSAAIARIHKLRADLVATPHGAEHDRIILELQAATADLKVVLDEGLAPHFSDLERVRPFHWGIEFPEVFYDAEGRLKENAGFTIIVGNPPWEIVKPDLREYYAQYDPRIESQLNRAQAEARIAELQMEDPRRAAEFERQNQVIEKTSQYVRQSPDYSRQGRGDTATHKLFLERSYAHLLAREGRIGYVVPSGIYTDLGTKDLREMLVNEGNIQYVYSFSNERFFFPGVDHRFKFCLIGAQKGSPSEGFWAAFRFNPRVAVKPDDLPAFLANQDNLIYVRRESLERFSPDSLSLMEFQTRWDYEIAEKIYDDWPLLGDEIADTWRLSVAYEFHMTNDRDIFNTNKQGLPLYEGKMFHQYDAFFGEPNYWVDEKIGDERYKSKRKSGIDYLYPRLAIRAIASSTNERTLISTIIPARVFSGHSVYTQVGRTISASIQFYLLGLLNSFVLDTILRQKMTTNVSLFHIYQLPVPRLNSGNGYFEAIVARAARLVCVRAEFAGLWREVSPPPGPLPASQGGGEVPGPLTEAERVQLRHEIDAIVAHLYGLTRAEFDHILGTFPLVFPDTEAGREKRAALLATYETWAGQLG